MVSSADHVFNMDLAPVIEQHASRGSVATLVTAEVTKKEAADNVAVRTGRGGVVRDLEVKVSRPSTGTVATEIFVYRTEPLLEALTTLRAELDDAEDGDDTGLGDFGEHLLPRLIETGSGARRTDRRVLARPRAAAHLPPGPPRPAGREGRRLRPPGAAGDLALARPDLRTGAPERPAHRQPALARVRRGRGSERQRARPGRGGRARGPGRRQRDLRRRGDPVGCGRADRDRRRAQRGPSYGAWSARCRPPGSPATTTSCWSAATPSWSHRSRPAPGWSPAPPPDPSPHSVVRPAVT